MSTPRLMKVFILCYNKIIYKILYFKNIFVLLGESYNDIHLSLLN